MGSPKIRTLKTVAMTPGAAYLEKRIAHLTREKAGLKIGRDARQIRKWLRKAPLVVELLAAVEADERKVAA
jgi:hypothetical protein